MQGWLQGEAALLTVDDTSLEKRNIGILALLHVAAVWSHTAIWSISRKMCPVQFDVSVDQRGRYQEVRRRRFARCSW